MKVCVFFLLSILLLVLGCQKEEIEPQPEKTLVTPAPLPTQEPVQKTPPSYELLSEVEISNVDDNTKCYYGKDYFVQIWEDFPDQKISIGQVVPHENPCEAKISESIVSLEQIEDPRNIIDLRGQYLILDSGCCPGSRGLEIYDLSTDKLILKDWHLSGEALIWLDDQKFSFWRIASGEREECDEAEKFENMGGTFGFEEKVIFHFNNYELETVGEKKCSYRM